LIDEQRNLVHNSKEIEEHDYRQLSKGKKGVNLSRGPSTLIFKKRRKFFLIFLDLSVLI
jgi:hypothetical protein